MQSDDQTKWETNSRRREDNTDLVDFLKDGPRDITRDNVVHNKPPHSSYPISAQPPPSSHFGTPPTGIIGVHHPREIVRVERDWSGGDVCQFHTTYPMELEDRITPTQFQHLINEINHHLILAHSLKAATWENLLAVLTWYTSLWWWTSTFERVRTIEKIIDEANNDTWNERGLNILSPRKVAFQFLEIEYF